MTRNEVYRGTLRHFFAPVVDLFDDPTVTEVLINGPAEIYFERKGTLFPTEKKFASDAALAAAVQNLAEYVGRRLDATHHSMNARLPAPEQFRVHAVIPPAARATCLSIRKFRPHRTTLQWYLDQAAMTPAAAAYLAHAVRAKKNVIVAGGTGTGKTTLLNALSAEIPADERIIVIEDTSELRLEQPHTVYLEAKPADEKGRGEVTIRDLFKDSLRMRPDRIVVGECRGGEALDLIQSMLSGHDGSVSTVHASTPAHALIRLETLCLMSETELPVYVARRQVSSAVHVIVQLSRAASGRRWVTDIAEVGGLNADQQYRLRTVFRRPHDGELTRTPRRPRYGPGDPDRPYVPAPQESRP